MTIKSVEQQNRILLKESAVIECFEKMQGCLAVFRNASSSCEDLENCQKEKNLVNQWIKRIRSSQDFSFLNPELQKKIEKIKEALPKYQEKIEELVAVRKKTEQVAKKVLQLSPAPNSLSIPALSFNSSSSTTVQSQKPKIDPFQQKADELLKLLKAPTMSPTTLAICRQTLLDLQQDKEAESIKGKLSLCEQALNLRIEISQLEKDTKAFLHQFLKNYGEKKDTHTPYKTFCDRLEKINSALQSQIIISQEMSSTKCFISTELIFGWLTDIYKLLELFKASEAVAISGTFNQFHAFKNPETGEDEFLGASLTSPCTFCVGLFLENVLNSEKNVNRVSQMQFSDLDSIVKGGKQKYGNFCQFLTDQKRQLMGEDKKNEVARDNKEEKKPHLKDQLSNFFDLIAGSGTPGPYDFTGLQRLGNGSRIKDYDTRQFKGALEYVVGIRNSRGAKDVSVGGVITVGNGETYAIAFIHNPATKQDEIAIFDSHGVRTGLTPAYILRFKNIEQAAQFLTFRCPYEAGQDERNQVSIVPVVASSVKLSAELAVAPTQQKKTPVELKQDTNSKSVHAATVQGFYELGLPIAPRQGQPAMTHAQIMKLSDDFLEQYHQYIQWLFPTTETGSFNTIKLNGTQDLQFFKTDAGRQKLMQSFDLMLSFYGLKRGIQDSKVKIEKINNEKFGKNVSGHNLWRLSRIITSLRLLGCPEQSQALYDCLMNTSNILGKTREEWNKANSVKSLTA